ncbi:MAG: NAD-dependent epimerase/dehydratase family protein [Actinobacteria bacterium]|nr:NAD-dependent epimerase/dehydratase family protein [Actinomycetota bacterium]
MSTTERLAGRQVLVTGASGFIGARLAERLVVECGAEVRVLVRRVGRAAPLSRLPVEIAVGDVRDPASLAAATRGCEFVFHCVRGIDGSERDRREIDVEGTRNLLEASAASGETQRFVHTSTVVVYDVPAAGELDELAPRGGAPDPYADAKRAGEDVARSYASRVPVTIVQPTVVYGPQAGVYGREILEELRTTRIPLINGGTGICNAVYVDDLVTAMMLAATSERAVGESFLISGAEHPTWAEFFGGFERMLGVSHTVPLSADEALAAWKSASRRAWLVPQTLRAIRGDALLRDELLSTREGVLIRRLAERLLPAAFFAPERWNDRSDPAERASEELPLAPFKPQVIDFLSSTAKVRIDKARELLGYAPAFGLADGLRLTEAWARWEGLLEA